MTLDNENFRYVDVTGIDNAVMLKESIFSRMKILAEKNKYGIFETTELGGRTYLMFFFPCTKTNSEVLHHGY